MSGRSADAESRPVPALRSQLFESRDRHHGSFPCHRHAGAHNAELAQLEHGSRNPKRLPTPISDNFASPAFGCFIPLSPSRSRTPTASRGSGSRVEQLISARPEYFYRIDAASQYDETRIGIVMGMQDANHFRTLEDVNAFYAEGQRLSQLTYNSSNALGDGCMVQNDRGLKPYGVLVIERMNQVGMTIDISHCGERTSLDAIAASKKPVLITHSNCRALAPPVARCKSDVVISACASRGGVLGLTSVRHFVRAKDPVTITDVLDHFDHAVKLAGVEHVGLGSDTDLAGPRSSGDASPLRHRSAEPCLASL